MTTNEAKLADIIVNYDQRVAEARDYIKTNFGVSSEYVEEEGMLRIYTENVNESLQLMAAKEYLENTFEPGVLLLNI
mgnify:CR=1 FL=1|jgi:hypothetical protein